MATLSKSLAQTAVARGVLSSPGHAQRTRGATRVARPVIVCHGAESQTATETVDGRAFRRALNKNENYNRNGFGHKKEMLERMEEEYTSKRNTGSGKWEWYTSIEEMRERGSEGTKLRSEKGGRVEGIKDELKWKWSWGDE